MKEKINIVWKKRSLESNRMILIPMNMNNQMILIYSKQT